MADRVVIPSTGCSPYDFGQSVAACGNALLVGAPYFDYAGRVADGERLPPPSAGLYERDAGGQWRLVQNVVSTGPVCWGGFGRTVGLAARVAAVGAPGYENGDGPVELFERQAGVLRRRTSWESPDLSGPYDDGLTEYGIALALDDRSLAVGAALAGLVDVGDGAVYVFDAGRGAGDAQAILRGPRPDENFGTALALGGDFLVVGASSAYSAPHLPGACYVFERQGETSWREGCRLAGRSAGEEFGCAVALDGRRFAVGAHGIWDPRRALDGRVDVFELNEGGCTRVASIAGAPSFGHAVALRGSLLAVGQPMHTAPGGPPQTGRVGLYRLGEAGGATLDGWIDPPQPIRRGRLGSALAFGPDYLAAGAPGWGRADGSGYVLVLTV